MTFAPGTLGSVSPVTVAIANGTASTTFTAGSAAGTTGPSVTLDNGTKTTSITVVGAPTANSQTVPVAHDGPGTNIALTGSDPNSLPLTYSMASSPAHGTITSFNTSTGAVTYTPSPGYHGSDSFTFKASNGTNASPAATVTLNVGVGTPTANAQAASTTQGTAVAIALTGSDDDSPALPLTYAIVPGQGPANGTISNFNPATGTLTYTPNAGYSGPDGFEFTVSNGTNTSAPAVVTVNTTAPAQATVSGTVGVTWGTSGTATLQTNADGLRLLPQGRNTDLPWLGINTISITLSQAEALSAGDVSVTGINLANYGPVTISGSGTSYTIALARPIDAADRVTVTVANAGIATFTRRLDVLPGDFNDDGVVNIQDAIGVRDEYLFLDGASPTTFGDINGDGTVDLNDYNAVRRLIGTRLP